MIEYISEWIFAPFAALSYFYLMFHLDKQFRENRKISDEEFLMMLARKNQCSEYDLFHRSAAQWNISNKIIIEKDFKGYLIEGDMPYYVKDFVRKERVAASV